MNSPDDLSRLLSAIITLLVLALIVRLYLRKVASKRPNIRKPDKKDRHSH